jgi:hypothetical protein
MKPAGLAGVGPPRDASCRSVSGEKNCEISLLCVGRSAEWTALGTRVPGMLSGIGYLSVPSVDLVMRLDDGSRSASGRGDVRGGTCGPGGAETGEVPRIHVLPDRAAEDDPPRASVTPNTVEQDPSRAGQR